MFWLSCKPRVRRFVLNTLVIKASLRLKLKSCPTSKIYKTIKLQIQYALLLVLPLSDHSHLADYPVTVFGVRLHTQKVQNDK